MKRDDQEQRQIQELGEPGAADTPETPQPRGQGQVLGAILRILTGTRSKRAAQAQQGQVSAKDPHRPLEWMLRLMG